MALLSIVALLAVVQLSHQTTYSCDPAASCGCSRKAVPQARIIGGETADTGAWAWTVSILIDSSNLCGGSILSSEWIITAAHCVHDLSASQIVVHAGSNIVWSGTQVRQVSQVIIHPFYSTNTFANDIALLRLESPLYMSAPGVGQICLPDISSAKLASGEWPPADTTASLTLFLHSSSKRRCCPQVVAVGWGVIALDGTISLDLQQVSLQVIDFREQKCKTIIDDPHSQLCSAVPDRFHGNCSSDLF